DIMFLDQGIFTMEGDGVEIKIERVSSLEAQFAHGVKPELQKFRIGGRINPAAIFGEKRALGDAVEPGKEGEALVKHLTHGMAVAGIAEEFQSKERSHGMSGRDHFGAGKPCLLDQLVEWYS